jgi:cytochrome b subunit of formate dehydrogenase
VNGEATGGRQYQRFTRLHRVQHIVMIVSFITLALTGMTLKFSYTGWARVLSQLFGGFESAGYVHRVGAVLMILMFASHLVDLVRRRNREYGSWRTMLFGPDTMLFTRRDLSEFLGSLKWFVGRGPRPGYGRWTYWEKFDYFAVFWGMVVIGSTGLMLWFPELLTHVLPGWLINVATIVHSDEALLAVGFIFTVHFFNTHFRPEKFPMDTVIFTRGIPLEEFKRDRPREYQELVESGKLEERLMPPPMPAKLKAWRIFGWIALSLGILMILLILYAAIFGYK